METFEDLSYRQGDIQLKKPSRKMANDQRSKIVHEKI